MKTQATPISNKANKKPARKSGKTARRERSPAFLAEAWSTPHFREFLNAITTIDPGFPLREPKDQSETFIAYSHALKSHPLSVYCTLERSEEALLMNLELGFYCTSNPEFNLLALKHCCEKTSRQKLPFRLRMEKNPKTGSEVLILQLSVPIEMISDSFSPKIIPGLMIRHALALREECDGQWKVFEASGHRVPEAEKVLH